MENIRKKCNPIVWICQNSHPIIKKNIKWSYSLNLQSNLSLNIVQSLIMLDLKYLCWSQIFFKAKKIINFKILYIIVIIFKVMVLL